MSAVGNPAAPGTIGFNAHVLPPSCEMKMGASEPPEGLGVKAVAAICSGLFGFTARFGSLSWFVSPLNTLGIMLTTVTVIAAFLIPWGAVLRHRLGRGNGPAGYPLGSLQKGADAL